MSVDARLFGDTDFIQLRAALVAEVGAVEAIVLSRIHYRATSMYALAYAEGGYWWWRAPVPTLAAETGLSEKQVRRALTVLEEAEHIVAEQHAREGRYDRAKSVRVNLIEGQMHLPQGADEDLPQRADVPIPQEVQDTPPTPSKDEQAFEALWAVWPNSKGHKPAQRAWAKLSATQKNAHIPAIVAHANAYRQYTPPRFIPMLSTFLNQERWTDPLAVGEDRGGRNPEPVKRTPYAIPPGHRAVWSDEGYIIGSEPIT